MKKSFTFTASKQQRLLRPLNTPEEPVLGAYINPASDRQLLRYFEVVRKKYFYPSNLGVALDDNDRTATGKPVPLNNLFVPPLLSTKQYTPEDIIRSEAENNVLDLQEVYQVVRHNPRLFLLGTPGTGKTTLVQWLMLALTYSGDNHVKGALGTVVPFALILRELKLKGIQMWEDLWRVFAEHSGLGIEQRLLETLTRTGQAFFLVDGLDEIADPQTRKGLGRALVDGMNRHPRCRFLITSRIVGFSLEEFLGLEKTPSRPEAVINDLELTRIERIERGQAEHLDSVMSDHLTLTYLAPFNAGQIRRFVTNWYSQYETDTAIQTERVADLVARIEKNDGLGQLSRIPVLLNMICFIHARRARLPDGRAELYERIAQTYLVSLDRARGLGFQGEDISVDYQDLSNWLATLAITMQERRNSEEDTVFATKGEIEAILLQGLEEKGTVASQCGAHCRFILDYIVKRSGFLVPFGREQGEEVYAFNHLSFQEYFAARALDEQISFFTQAKQWNALRKHLRQPHWLETFILLFEIQPSVKKADYLVTQLMGDNLQHLPAKEKKKKADQDDIPFHWLLAAHITMDTAVRLGRDRRGRLITAGWQAVLPFITDENTFPPKGLLAQQRQNIASQVAAVLFQNQFDSLERFKEIFADEKRLYLTGSLIRDISPLLSLPNLELLSLADTGVSDVSSLSNLTNLKWIFLDNTGVSDVGCLSSLSNLELLSLDNTGVRDVSSFTSLINLQWLSFRNAEVSDVSCLSSLTNLQSLSLDNTEVSDVSWLSSLTNLRWLSLDNTGVSDVSSLTNLTNLQCFFLANTGVNDISSLSSLTNLKLISLNNTGVNDVSSLSGLANLKLLILDNTEVSDVSSLSNLPNLEGLYLAETGVSDVSCLSGLTSLESLSLVNTEVSDVSSLSSLTNLKRLSLDNTEVSDVNSLSNLTNLEVLSLANTGVNDVSSLANLKKLRIVR